MTAQRSPIDDRIWRQVERDKRIDRLLRRVTIGAWAFTLVLVLMFAVLTAVQLAAIVRSVLAGALPWSVVVGSAIPILVVLGLLSMLVATLGTVAMFLRLRTASLLEIQLRLSALEEMLTSRADGMETGRPAG